LPFVGEPLLSLGLNRGTPIFSLSSVAGSGLAK